MPIPEEHSPDAPLEDAFKKFVSQKRMLVTSDYTTIIKNWSACFPREQIFTGFYDDLVRTPENFMSRVFDFLGLNGGQASISTINHKINASLSMEMPHNTGKYLARLHYAQIKEQSEILGSYAVKWLEEAEKLINS